MNRKLLIGIIVVFVIAAAILTRAFFLFLFLAVWIYLVWMVWKKKTDIFHDQMEPKLAERRLKRLKVFLLVAGISLAVLIVLLVGVVIYDALYGLSETDDGGIADAVAHYIAFSSLGVFIVATIGGLVIFLKGRRKIT